MPRLKRNIMDDGFQPELAEGALFDGLLEMPLIKRSDEIVIPARMVPFSKRKHATSSDFICFNELDPVFSDVVKDPASFVGELKGAAGIVSTDNSLYFDCPLAVQIANTYRNRVIGHFFQKNGLNVVPLIRWSDERTYTTEYLPEKLAFLGVEKNAVVSVGTFGAIQTRKEKYHFKAGLEAMLEELTPVVVLVYGSKPANVFGEYESCTEFVQYPDWTTLMKGGDR